VDVIKKVMGGAGVLNIISVGENMAIPFLLSNMDIGTMFFIMRGNK
jgi:hypothetical protein